MFKTNLLLNSAFQVTTGLIQMVVVSVMLLKCTATSPMEWLRLALCPRRVKYRERAGVAAPSGSAQNKEVSRCVYE